MHSDDSAFATLNDNNGCLEVAEVVPETGQVKISAKNDCLSAASLGPSSSVAVLVYDK